MGRALVIVGHGSQRNPGTRLPICEAVKRIKALGLYEEVRCGLWKEEPHISQTLDAIASDDITIVPFFISQGYYTEEVIPREMKLDGPVTHREGKVIRYTAPVGEHPCFSDLIVQRAKEAGAHGGETLVVLGHGTPRNPRSAEHVYLQTERVRRLGAFPEVITVFIDQEPNMKDVFELATRQRIVMVPLFVADGWHVTETIPDDLNMQEGKVLRGERELIYASAVGTDPDLYRVILELAGSEASDVSRVSLHPAPKPESCSSCPCGDPSK